MQDSSKNLRISNKNYEGGRRGEGGKKKSFLFLLQTKHLGLVTSFIWCASLLLIVATVGVVDAIKFKTASDTEVIDSTKEIVTILQ